MRPETRLFTGFLGIMLMVMLASLMGLPALFQVVVDDPTDGGEPTLEDYDAVREFSLENETLIVDTEEFPRFAAASSVAQQKVTHLRVIRDIGGINESAKIYEGQTRYSFALPNDYQTGNYTLILEVRKPANPGLFGSPPRTYTQTVKFQVTDEDEIAVIEVPFSARYNNN
jgi:hypothetical protein